MTKAQCYICGTLETIHELDNICEKCLDQETELTN
jgi:hypothetical protein